MMPFGESQSKVIRAYAQSEQYHIIVESRWGLLDPTFQWRPFGEAQIKAMRLFVQSGQYHTIVWRPHMSEASWEAQRGYTQSGQYHLCGDPTCHFWEAPRGYTQSGQYHTIVESCVRLLDPTCQ